MMDFIKKGAKGAADLGGSALKGAAGALLAEVTKEILEETGVKNIAKEKLTEVGMNLINDMGVNPVNMQKELLKTAIMKEFDLHK